VALDPREKALMCQRSEHEFAGVPCGIMDMTASAMGEADHALLIDCRSHEVTAIPMPRDVTVVVANTGVHHALAGGEYAKRRAACERAARAMGKALLRDATLDDLRGARGVLGDEERRCATHVIEENARTLDAAGALRRGDLRAMGRLMHASHESLRDQYRVSCPELDTLVEIASATDGVYGSRMTGGGFGGCTVTLARPVAVDRLVAALRTGYRATHGVECDVYLTRASYGARALTL